MNERMNQYINKIINLNPDNVVDALGHAVVLKQLSGTVVFTHQLVDNVVVVKLARLGCFCYVAWYILFWYCFIQSILTDQSIILSLYKTKFKFYGDYFLATLTAMYVVYSMWKIPFGFNRGKGYIEVIVTIDQVLKHATKAVDYPKLVEVLVSCSIIQILLVCSHFLSIVGIFYTLGIKPPYELIFVTVYKHFLVLNSTAHYASLLYILKVRFRAINNQLTEIKRVTSDDRNVKFLRIEKRLFSSTIRRWGVVYGQLSRASDTANRMFGLSLNVTLFFCVLNLFIHLFYVIEVHAQELHATDLKIYICTLVYAGVLVLYEMGLVVFITCHCETTVQEAKKTSHILHQIINSAKNPTVASTAMRVSHQLLQHSPAFAINGFYKLEFLLLFQGFRTITVFLIILLQLVMNQ